jgi:putative transposase
MKAWAFSDAPKAFIFRICNALGLQLRNRVPKRRVSARLREDQSEATQPNETWALDFVQDQLATGREIQILTIVDIFSSDSPLIYPGTLTGRKT